MRALAQLTVRVAVAEALCDHAAFHRDVDLLLAPRTIRSLHHGQRGVVIELTRLTSRKRELLFVQQVADRDRTEQAAITVCSRLDAQIITPLRAVQTDVAMLSALLLAEVSLLDLRNPYPLLGAWQERYLRHCVADSFASWAGAHGSSDQWAASVPLPMLADGVAVEAARCGFVRAEAASYGVLIHALQSSRDGLIATIFGVPTARQALLDGLIRAQAVTGSVARRADTYPMTETVVCAVGPLTR